jgi:hypothetical protein
MRVFFEASQQPLVTDRKMASNPHEYCIVTFVTLCKPVWGKKGCFELWQKEPNANRLLGGF